MYFSNFQKHDSMFMKLNLAGGCWRDSNLICLCSAYHSENFISNMQNIFVCRIRKFNTKSHLHQWLAYCSCYFKHFTLRHRFLAISWHELPILSSCWCQAPNKPPAMIRPFSWPPCFCNPSAFMFRIYPRLVKACHANPTPIESAICQFSAQCTPLLIGITVPP